jgi:excisionase family DNA binding protein
MTDELLTTEKAADYLKISKRTLFRMVHAGKIRCLKVGNTYRFKQIELDEDLGINTKRPYDLEDIILSQEERTERDRKNSMEFFMSRGERK